MKKYTSYLDWLELVYKYNEEPFMKLNIINKDTLANTDDNEKKIKLSKKKQVLEKIENIDVNKEN